MTKSLLLVSVGGVLARLMPMLTLSGEEFLGSNFFDPAYTSSRLCEFREDSAFVAVAVKTFTIMNHRIDFKTRVPPLFYKFFGC